jgi:type IX secretion system PorP/SprF family membrane protein
MKNPKFVFIFLLLLFLVSVSSLYSQENSIFKNDYINPFITNPACTGSDYYPSAQLSVKRQWLGFPGAPSTYLLSGNLRIGNFDFYDPKGFVNKGPLKIKDRLGVGAAIFKDINGPLANTGGLLSYAYHLPVNKESRLALGMSVLMVNYSLNAGILKPDQSIDDYLWTGNESTFKLNFGAGVYYYNESFFAGLSFNRILPGISNVNGTLELNPSYFALAGFKINKTSNIWTIEPSLGLKKMGETNLIADIHTKLYIQRYNWAAISYSTSNQINAQFALRLYRTFYFGYNYGLSLSRIASFNYGTHEISLGINLGLIGVKGVM